MPKVDLGSELSFGELVVKSCNKKMFRLGRLLFLEKGALRACVSRAGPTPAPHQYQIFVKKLDFLRKCSFYEETNTFAAEIQTFVVRESIFSTRDSMIVRRNLCLIKKYVAA